MPEPSTVAAMTQRAAGVPYAISAAGTCGSGLIRGRLPAVADPADLIDTRLRVLTWNLWWRFGPWEARQPAILATLRRIDADVIALQETWDDPGSSQVRDLADALGYHHAYGTGFAEFPETFGNAVLSRWPVAGTETRRLPTVEGLDELRVVLRAQIDGPRGAFDVYSTHTNWRLDQSHVRQLQVKGICESVRQRPGDLALPPIVCGDFNADPDSDEIRMMTGKAAVPVAKLVFIDAWVAGGDGGPGYTWSNVNAFAAEGLEPDRRLDYVFVGYPRPGGAGQVTTARVEGVMPVDGINPSDHYAMLAELRY
jgi:endonuclease/exonuclease/phosphatase family metal-dependent hydrolase